MQFEFATAARILFGPGRLREVAPLAAGLGRRALVVTGRDIARAGPLLAELNRHAVEAEVFTVSGEPDLATVQAGVQRARTAPCDLVIGVGGGSALDAGKAIAALLTNGGELMDYLEVIGAGRPLTQPSAPYIAIPTTAGTGSEVTRNAVLGSPQHRVKVSVRSPHMLPRLAVVDPELTHSLPPAVTAHTGLDALTQLVEPFVSNSANPMTDALSREGMRRVARSLRRAYENGSDAAAREDMALAGMLGGMALASAKLGAVHGLANPIGGACPAPHGAICARLLPIVMQANVRALQSRAPDAPALARFVEVAQILTGRAGATLADGIAWVQNACAAMRIEPLSRYGLSEADGPVLVAQAQQASSMKGNPVPLTDEEVAVILRQAL
jgi:alcohol dehydrogenase class IV